MRMHRTFLAAIAIGALVVAGGCSTNRQGDDGSPSYLTAEFRDLILAQNVGCLCYLQIPTVNLQNVLKAGEAYAQLYFVHQQWMAADKSVWPWRLSWIGEVPSGETLDVAGMKKELAQLQRALSDADAARGKISVLEEQIQADQKAVVDLTEKIPALGIADELPALLDAQEQADRACNEVRSRITEIDQQIAEIKAEIDKAKALYAQAVARVDAAKKEQAKAVADLEQLGFNNTLLKRVKAARPVIADRLWSVVLSAVSVYFSQMRGVKSTVSKDSSGFKVDGQTVEGLTGSTLDCLGLAIRMALTKTFLPQAPFLILDEPSAAMDTERTASTIGFLVGAGFKQTLLVTHEEVSESMADNLILI